MHKFISYMITDPSYSLREIFEALKNKKPDFVCYRNKEYFNEAEIKEFAKFAKRFSKTFINYDSLQKTDLLELFDGIHLPSSKLYLIENFKTKTVIASTHTADEAQRAKKADFITFSPVFESKNRPGLGIEALNKICDLHKNVIALGGIITQKEIETVKKSKACGFGSIRYFFT